MDCTITAPVLLIKHLLEMSATMCCELPFIQNLPNRFFSESVQHDSPWFAGALLSILLLLPFSLMPQQMHQPHCSDGFNSANFYFTCSWAKQQLTIILSFTEKKNTASISIILFTNPHTPPPPSLNKMKWQTETWHLCRHRQGCSEMALLASSSNLSGHTQTKYPSNILPCPGKEIQQQEAKRKTWTGTRWKINAAYPDKKHF